MRKTKGNTALINQEETTIFFLSVCVRSAGLKRHSYMSKITQTNM